MIIKKPYAFLIKHFRVIHFALIIPMLYLISQTKEIIGFFNTYIASDYSLNFISVLSNLSSNYINILMYLAVIVIICVFIVISLLLQNKEKPTKFYNISIIYYIIIFVLITASFSFFQGIENDTISDTIVRIIRDFAYLIHYSQYIFVAFTIVRGLGFNIKKFNFQSDLQDLEISSEDSEEVEFLIGADTYKTKRTIRRFFRELTYYYKENKFIFTIIFILAIGILGTVIYMNREVYQKVYSENESIAFGNINLIIKDTYISNLSANGEVISEDKSYVIMQVNISNRFTEDKDFNYANLQLVAKKKNISPNIYASTFFYDYGHPYNGTLIKGNSSTDIILVYEIDKKDIAKSYTLKAYSRYDTTPGGLGAVSRKIKIRPTTTSSKVTNNNIYKGTNVNLTSTNLLETKATIINYELANSYEYSYENCISPTNCYDAKNYITISGKDIGLYTLLILDYNLELDLNSPYMNTTKDYKNFFQDFMKIKYTVNNEEYYTDVSLTNPPNYKEKLVLKVPRNINNATKIEAVITVRNISYSIKLL